MTPEQLMKAVPEDVWVALTDDGDDGKAKLLAKIVFEIYGLAYAEGQKSGMRLLAEIAAKAAQ